MGTPTLLLLAGLGLLLIGDDLMQAIGLFNISHTEKMLIFGLPALVALVAGFVLLPWAVRLLAKLVTAKGIKGVVASASVAIHWQPEMACFC